MAGRAGRDLPGKLLHDFHVAQHGASLVCTGQLSVFLRHEVAASVVVVIVFNNGGQGQQLPDVVPVNRQREAPHRAERGGAQASGGQAPSTEHDRVAEMMMARLSRTHPSTAGPPPRASAPCACRELRDERRRAAAHSTPTYFVADSSRKSPSKACSARAQSSMASGAGQLRSPLATFCLASRKKSFWVTWSLISVMSSMWYLRASMPMQQWPVSAASSRVQAHHTQAQAWLCNRTAGQRTSSATPRPAGRDSAKHRTLEQFGAPT